MATPLQNVNLIAPGFQGINTEDSPLAQDQSFAEVADNAVIDRSGRLAARKGYLVATTDKTQLGTAAITAIGEYRDDAGNTKLFSTGNNKILSGTETLVDETPGAYTISNDNWKIVNFNDNLYFFQRDQEPLVYNNALGAVTQLSGVAGALGVTSAMYGNEAIAAYGRLWTADITGNKSIVYWSDLLLGAQWTGGSSGSVDISDVWPNGYDEITALAAYNNFLIIFGKNSIVVYSGADSPASMVLADTVAGIGCVDRDTVQHTGTDVIFLSASGVRSFSRTIQEKSMPITERSRNVRQSVIALVNGETQFRSLYSPEESFYLLISPTFQLAFCFDTRAELENGSYRTTRWIGLTFTGTFRDDDGTIYIGNASGICTYEGYLDGTSTYPFRYESPALSFGDSSRLKMLKKVKTTLVGGSGENVTLSWGYDFNVPDRYSNFTVGDNLSGEYGNGKFGESGFARGRFVTRKSVNTSGSGEVVVIGFIVDVNGTLVSIQEMNVLATIGKVL